MSRRQHEAPVVDDPRVADHVLEPVERLRDDPGRLAHLLHVHPVAVVDVAVVVDGNAEIDLVVRQVRLGLAEIPVDAGGAQHRA